MTDQIFYLIATLCHSNFIIAKGILSHIDFIK